MTRKSVIVTTSVILGLIAMFTILFGVVFRIKNIKVVYADNFCYKAQIDDILDVSDLDKNDSMFSVNRAKVTSNIEQAYPYARVEGVNISSFTSVKIKLSNRQPLYYIVEEAIYYILDEDCKVLEITNNNQLATQYILLKDVFNMSESVQVGQFVEDKYTQLCNNLYKAMYSNAVLNIGDDSNQDGIMDEKYLDRNDICQVIEDIKFTQSDELAGKVDNLVMTTSYGVNLSIVEPQKDLDYKINSVFSALRTLILKDRQNGTNLATKGSIVIRYSYDENNKATLKCEYHV